MAHFVPLYHKLSKRAPLVKVADAVESLLRGMVEDSGGECLIDEDMRWNLEIYDGALYAVCGGRKVRVIISAEKV